MTQIMIKPENEVPSRKNSQQSELLGLLLFTENPFWCPRGNICCTSVEEEEEEELEEEDDDVATTKACNWLCSVRLTEEDKLPRNSADRNFTARLFSNKWARTRRSGLLRRQRRQRQ